MVESDAGGNVDPPDPMPVLDGMVLEAGDIVPLLDVSANEDFPEGVRRPVGDGDGELDREFPDIDSEPPPSPLSVLADNIAFDVAVVAVDNPCELECTVVSGPAGEADIEF